MHDENCLYWRWKRTILLKQVYTCSRDLSLKVTLGAASSGRLHWAWRDRYGDLFRASWRDSSLGLGFTIKSRTWAEAAMGRTYLTQLFTTTVPMSHRAFSRLHLFTITNFFIVVRKSPVNAYKSSFLFNCAIFWFIDFFSREEAWLILEIQMLNIWSLFHIFILLLQK